MLQYIKKQPLVGLALTVIFLLSPTSARAEKWASATLHTKQPIDRVFDSTAKLIASKEWYLGTRWHIQSSDKKLKAIHATTVSFGQQWGDIYVWMSPEGTGTCIQTVMTLRAEAHLHPADYAERFGKGMKKLFPDLTYKVERDKTPSYFSSGPAQVSVPLVATAVAIEQPPISITQTAAATTIVQVWQPGGSLFDALADMAQERDERAELKYRQIDEMATINAVSKFLDSANNTIGQYLVTTGSESTERWIAAAQAINRARDDAYATLANPIQRAKFNRSTNSDILTFARQMAKHAIQQASASRELNQETVVANLNRALDCWYANGKDWTKIPQEVWSKLSARDQGRLKDGIDPEMGLRQ